MRQKFLFSSFTALTLCLSLFTLVVYGHSIEDSSTDHHSGATQEAILTIDQISSEATGKPALSKWLHMLDKHESAEIENSSVMAFAPQVPGDLARVLRSVGGDEGVKGIFKAFFLSIFSIGVGFLVVLGAKRIAKKGITQLEQITPPGDDFIARFWAGLVKCIPTLTAVVLLALSSTLVFLFLAGSVTIEGRMLFQLLLGIVLIIRLCSILTHIIFAPGDASLRPFTLDDSVAKALHNALFISIAISLSGKLFIDFFKDLGALEQSVSWVAIVIGTILIAVFCYLVLGLRTPISNFLQLRVEKGDSKRIKGQLAAYWHIPALLYLFVAWFIGVGREIAGVIERDGSFLISLFIVPIFIVRHADRSHTIFIEPHLTPMLSGNIAEDIVTITNANIVL